MKTNINLQRKILTIYLLNKTKHKILQNNL